MFRRLTLKRSLRKLAKLLISRYGINNNYYSIGQIDITMKKYKIKKDEYIYFKLLFLNEVDYSSVTGSSNYTEDKKSLYLFINSNIRDYNIKKNNFRRLLDIDINKFDNCHTPIGPNSNINGCLH